MKSFNDLERWTDKRYKEITFLHKNKNRRDLQKTLTKLEAEQHKIIQELHSLGYFFNLTDQLCSTTVSNPTGGFNDYGQYKSWLKELKKALNKLNRKPKGDFTKEEKEFIDREKSRLLHEKEKLEKYLRIIDEIIAKATILYIDVEETYCRELTKGHSIADVGQALLEKFGNKLQPGYTTGRDKMIDFFKDYYQTDHALAVELFKVLQDRKVIIYDISIPKGKMKEDIYFYTPYIEQFMTDTSLDPVYIEPIYGHWIINA